MATIIEAIGQASANSTYVAARPTGLIVIPQRRGAILKLGKERKTPWQPNVFDLCADDWLAGPLPQVLKALGSINAG